MHIGDLGSLALKFWRIRLYGDSAQASKLAHRVTFPEPMTLGSYIEELGISAL
jgi:hypothetical protein